MKKIYIDGVWGLGKSTLCRLVAERQHLTYIDEPVFPVKMSQSCLSEEIIETWYLNAYLGNTRLADAISADVVLERSMVSTLTYHEYYEKNIGSRQDFIERYLKLNIDSIFILLDFDYPDFLAIKDRFKDYRKSLFTEHAGLIREYENIFSSIMSAYFSHLKYYRVKSLDDKGHIDIETVYKEIDRLIQNPVQNAEFDHPSSWEGKLTYE